MVSFRLFSHHLLFIRKLAAFLRLPDNSFAPTGAKAHKIRVSGYLMWDDEHNKPDTDLGSTIGWFSKEGYHHPWRSPAGKFIR
jgi:hypothetical protein